MMKKKQIVLLLIILSLMASCHRHSKLPEITSTTYKIYQLYATRENLTVSMIGDYSIDSCCYNAVMIQTMDSLAWEQLLEEFGMSNSNPKTNEMVAGENCSHQITCTDLQEQLTKEIDSMYTKLAIDDSCSIGMKRGRKQGSSPLIDSLIGFSEIGYITVREEDKELRTLLIFVISDLPQLYAIINYIFHTKIRSHFPTDSINLINYNNNENNLSIICTDSNSIPIDGGL